MSFWYLASPYRSYPGSRDEAHDAVCVVAGQLIDLGLEVYSPIAHSHTIANSVFRADPHSSFWLNRQVPFLRAASGILVVKMPGWTDSKGVAFELDFTRLNAKPCYYLPYPLRLEEPRARAVLQCLLQKTVDAPT